ncbi:MAG: 1-(5-phosphoribosyl)-5-[(5-phosphoribosylamino)methylideneamino] imidazole-4-carboxamide isomerase [Gemmatimonadales bacterium]
MQIYPAIDIKGGRVVRLLEGDTVRETEYSDSPVTQAQAFLRDGASWLHVVDMDRAFDTGDNSALVKEIATLEGVRVQVGGDIANLEWAREAVKLGAQRIVLGTSAVVAPQLLERLVDEVGPERCALAIDTRDGRPALRRGGSVHESVAELVNRAIARGVTTIVYRDLARDGMVSGADVVGARRVAEMGVDVIVAGGVSGIDDLRTAAAAGIAGAIVGRALYESRLTLREAIACSR